MVNKKLKLGVLFGGKSAEHEVSLQSARNVIKALDKNKYKVIPIKINKDGKFKFDIVENYDVIFPVMHGPFGEDGSMQGLLKLAGVPYVGAGVLGSAVGMDKDVMKRLLMQAKIPIGKFITLLMGNEKISFDKVKKELGMPVFIKPANMGSSVGVSKARNERELNRAMKEAFKFDTKIIIEEFIDGREFAIAVLGNEDPRASGVCEIITDRSFYDYKAKYSDEYGATIDIPAKISKTLSDKASKIAVNTYKVLECQGMARVDFFLRRKDDKLVICELNTIPGFTAHSMYPKLWEASGMPLPKLLDKLIDLAIERFKKEQKLKTTVS